MRSCRTTIRYQACRLLHMMDGDSIAEKTSRWNSIQKVLRNQVITESSNSMPISTLTRIGGLDISFHISDDMQACVTLVVVVVLDPESKKFEVIYKDSCLVEMEEPYIPGFLGFREVKFFRERLNVLKEKDVDKYPEIVLVDGNGILHCNRFGSASHLGVECNLPTIGVAKNLYVMKDEGILRDEEHKSKRRSLCKSGDQFPVKTAAGDVLAMAVRTTDGSTKPVYVSIGHRCSLEDAVEIVLKYSKYRIPEPIRQADKLSREFLCKKFPADCPRRNKR